MDRQSDTGVLLIEPIRWSDFFWSFSWLSWWSLWVDLGPNFLVRMNEEGIGEFNGRTWRRYAWDEIARVYVENGNLHFAPVDPGPHPETILICPERYRRSLSEIVDVFIAQSPAHLQRTWARTATSDSSHIAP